MRVRTKIGMVATILCLAMASSAFAADWKFSLEGWSALQSRFNENPGPETTGHVWGKFDTQYLTGTAEYRVLGGLIAGLTAGYLMIFNNTMYLHSKDTFTTFDGNATQVVANLYYRFWEQDKNRVDIGAGYQYVQAIKQFYDLTSLDTVINPGKWGNYKITYSGEVFNLRDEFWPLPQFGVSAGVVGSPAMSNATEVTGYGPVQKETTTGLRFRFEGALRWEPAPRWEAALGYRYEDLYFQEPDPASFDLAIVYGGPFVSVGYSF